MKKISYIQPETIVVRLKTRHLIMESNSYNGGSSSAKFNTGTMSTGDGGDAASRRGGLWDDDED